MTRVGEDKRLKEILICYRVCSRTDDLLQNSATRANYLCAPHTTNRHNKSASLRHVCGFKNKRTQLGGLKLE